MSTLHTVMLSVGVGLVGLAGCAIDDTTASDGPVNLPLGSTAQAATVSSYVGGGGCSTAVVIGLSKQISDEVACIDATKLQRFSPSATLTLSSNAVLPYLGKTAANDLVAASQEASIQINSAFRSIAQQYLLYRWYVNGQCGITAAATVGHSNHEGGRAVDVANYSSRISVLSRHGWAHDVPGDPVHFDHTSSADIRGIDTLAFQKLWNLNNPNDVISEDGSYGPQTEARLKKSPATGFAIGPSCTRSSSATQTGATVVAVDGPDRAPQQTQVHYALTLQNSGTTDWPASAELVTADGAASPLYDAATWTSNSEISTLGMAVPAGQQIMLDVDLLTPTVTEETPMMQELALVDGSTTLGTLQIALTVTPPGTDPSTPSSTDGDDKNDDAQTVSGGCSTGGTSGTGALVLVGLALATRRRRARS